MKKIMIAVLAISFMYSCKKKDDPNPGTTTTAACNGSMTVNMNGVNYPATGFNNSLIHTDISGEKVRRMDIRSSVNGGTLVLTLSNWDWQNPPKNGVVVKTYENDPEKSSCKNVNGNDLCDETLGTFLKNNDTYSSGPAETGFLKITKVDATNKSISGTYDFTLINFDEDSIQVTGTFTDQCYTVYE